MKIIILDVKYFLFNLMENCNEIVLFFLNLCFMCFFFVMYIKVIWGVLRSFWNMELMVRCVW